MLTRIPWAKTALLCAAAGVTGVFFINWCGWVFDCGCEGLWAGAATHCNINNPEPPHCPWCIEGGRWGGVAFFSILAAQAGLAFRPGALTLGRVVAVFLAFPLVGAILAWVMGWWTGYRS